MVLPFSEADILLCDPASLAVAALTTAVTSGIGAGVTALTGGFKKPKAPKMPELPSAQSSLNEGKKITGLQKAALINTSPSGLLETETVGRAKLLGN